MTQSTRASFDLIESSSNANADQIVDQTPGNNTEIVLQSASEIDVESGPGGQELDGIFGFNVNSFQPINEAEQISEAEEESGEQELQRPKNVRSCTSQWYGNESNYLLPLKVNFGLSMGILISSYLLLIIFLGFETTGHKTYICPGRSVIMLNIVAHFLFFNGIFKVIFLSYSCQLIGIISACLDVLCIAMCTIYGLVRLDIRYIGSSNLRNTTACLLIVVNLIMLTNLSIGVRALLLFRKYSLQATEKSIALKKNMRQRQMTQPNYQ